MTTQIKNKYDRIFNFSAGPSALPLPVLERLKDELLNCEGSGMSVMEMSHRSKEFDRILERAETGFRKNLNIPADYAVLFLQGGASMQFAMAPMNLYIKGKPVDMIHTGIWTGKAIEELEKVCPYRLAATGKAVNFTRLPKGDEIKLDANASYVHIASNNTIFGTQWKQYPKTGDVPIVCDMSSDIFSRPVDVKQFGMIFAGAQKNIGPSGLCVVIIRKDFAERADKGMPIMLQYRTHIEHGSRYNTPPTFGIYMAALVMEWITKEGGVSAIEKRNQEKAKVLYDAIDGSSYYYSPIAKEDRSLMNVPFRIKGDKEDLEDRFAKEADKAGLSGLKGHRSIGGLRASIYNAQPIEAIQALVSFMKEFAQKNG